MFKQGGIVLSREKVRTQAGPGRRNGTCECGWDEESGSGLVSTFHSACFKSLFFTNDYSRGWLTLHISLASCTIHDSVQYLL